MAVPGADAANRVGVQTLLARGSARRRELPLRVGAPLLLALLVAACAHIEPRRYGLNELHLEGVHVMDPDALRACLASQPREKVTLGLAALRKPECGVPPFDRARAAKRLFAWGWSDWPVYDEAILKLDLERISRWYRARGYYGTRVLDVRFDPSAAKQRDESNACPNGCPLDITIVVQEGEPVRVRKVALSGAEQLSSTLAAELHEGLMLKPGELFDESVYDRAKEALAKLLREAGYARAKVSGEVVVERPARAADVHFAVDPGPVCRIGEVRVQTREAVPTKPILATTLLRPGAVYRESELDDAQRAVFALGAFSTVNVHSDLETKALDVVDVVIEVEPRRASQVSLGAGLMSGVLATGAAVAEPVSVPQWDVHLLASYEHRNFFGGLRRFRVEERPRMLFLGQFPQVPDKPRFGNLISASFSQPGVIEPRTTLFVESRWDWGPDPFQLFFRHDAGVALGLERGFFRQQLRIRVAIHQEAMFVSKGQPILESKYPKNPTAEQMPPACRDPDEMQADGDTREVCPRSLDEVVPSSYRLPFLEQRFTLDLRDSTANTTRGIYLALSVHEAARVWDPSWNYVRMAPEARGYLPLGLGLVLAGRFGVGALYIFDFDRSLDPDAQKLGPQAYRLRGGGAQSNRGFLPGQLGDSRKGGIRSWESSLELRVPLAESFSLVGFCDMGDVNGQPEFRFSHFNTAFGGGLRYRTIVGPIRLDVGYRPKNLQRKDGAPGEDDSMNFGSNVKFHGAVHLTIGEAF
jgi:outer membrane translocation and assembly module TamA